MSKMKQIVELLTEGITYDDVIREINYREEHDKSDNKDLQEYNSEFLEGMALILEHQFDEPSDAEKEKMTKEAFQKSAEMTESVGFTIVQKPSHISFECPFCGHEQEVNFDDVDVPDYWGDDWGSRECESCHTDIPLGDYDID